MTLTSDPWGGRLVSMVQPDYLSTLHVTFPLGMERFTAGFPDFRPLTEA